MRSTVVDATARTNKPVTGETLCQADAISSSGASKTGVFHTNQVDLRGTSEACECGTLRHSIAGSSPAAARRWHPFQLAAGDVEVGVTTLSVRGFHRDKGA